MRNTESYSRTNHGLLVAALVIVGGLIATALVLCPSASASPSHKAKPAVANVTPRPVYSGAPATGTLHPVTLAVYGDSISAWNGSTPIAHTWTQDLSVGPVEVNYADGYAHGGYTLGQIEANVHPASSNFVVIMAGINSVGPKTLDPSQKWGTAMADMELQLYDLATLSGVPANRIVVTTIAPDATLLPSVAAWNTEEQAMCTIHGWHCIDPYADLRDPATGAYYTAFTLDGIHPNDVGSQMLALSIAKSVQSFQ